LQKLNSNTNLSETDSSHNLIIQGEIYLEVQHGIPIMEHQAREVGMAGGGGSMADDKIIAFAPPTIKSENQPMVVSK
jgi:hypothetical protein